MHISIMAGTLDTPSGLKLAAHIFADDKHDYFEITDGLAQFAGNADRDLWDNLSCIDNEPTYSTRPREAGRGGTKARGLTVYQGVNVFTGIVQEVATIEGVQDHDGIRTFDIRFPPGFCRDLNVGASVAVDGVCLTVTELVSECRATFDVILQSLRVTTLGSHIEGGRVNVERAAKDGAEIGGHPLSGHVDFRAELLDIEEIQGNCRLRFGFSDEWGRYIFPKGYIAINGCSLTLSEVDRKAGYFEIWLIPETRRATTFSNKVVGDWVNIEIERGTQVVVDTIQTTLEDKLGSLYPLLEHLMQDYQAELGQSLTRKLSVLSNDNDNDNDKDD